MMKKGFATQLCLLVLVVLFFFGQALCLAGRVELKHDAGPRNVMAYWEAFANPFGTQGLAVQFKPSGFPCFVRKISVFVNSMAEFRVHILDFDEVELCDIATVSAVEPVSWAVYDLPSNVRVDSDGFWVVAEIVNAPEPGIGTTYEPDGGTTKYTKDWYSETGISYTGYGGYGGNAMIRAVVDVPVSITSISSPEAPNGHLFITFDSPMDASTLNAETISIKDSHSQAVPGRYKYDESLRRVEFTPDSLLAHGFFSLDISTAVTDVYGNYLAAPLNRLFVLDKDVEVDETPPMMPGNLSLQAEETITATWEAVPLADAVGYYLYSGPCPPGMTEEQWLANAQKTDVGNVVEASVLVAQKEQPYQVGVSAYDTARNESEISFQQAVVHRAPVLLVVESPSPIHLCYQGQDELRECLDWGTFDYNLWLEWERGDLPDVNYLSQFDCVFWSMGQRFVSENAGGVFDILQPFLSAGGSLYYESRFLLSREIRSDPFFPNWLHLTYLQDNNDSDAPVVGGAPGDPVGDGLELIYVTLAGKAKDYFEPQDGAVGFLNVKDKADEVCGLRYADTGDYGYRLVFSTAILSLVYNTDDRDKLMSRGLCWLEGREIDFRIASNTRVLEPYNVLQLFVSANTLAGVEADVDAYLAVLFELADGSTGLLFYDGTGFVSDMTPFVSGVHLESGMFLPRTKIFEYLVRDGLPSGKYTFFVALMQAGTQTFLTEPRSTTVFMK